ncbi:MAG: hypothetical protein COV74_07900 [Candidatus Omnitrophica bacterium CG11_big_fil_rev_8_21_14_0_20_45_26]|uniref:TonB-dependent receptor n=1 Tax=Candidatus Abzuiibacterium crystallinum TaxID=1974748 RepID=A0A2H0LME7_9BACT|nr:MAG: hypothetical protein COV74_07900 [Candidatus Omnitrophica bacterium CG11_big_fil_rev_8_21_14_0_20_45_26]PIW65144.1 MAG: hypothetical protein COW12_02940 [Candidatus Omnitrophica bacterium CG12_big_fil_rev_8_21_14_0_65_45_16]
MKRIFSFHSIFLIALCCFLSHSIVFAESSTQNDASETESTLKDKLSEAKDKLTDVIKYPFEVLKKPIDALKLPTLVYGILPVSASRLPGLVNQIQDFPNNITLKDSVELARTKPSTFQEAVRDVEGVLTYDQVGNGLDETFGLRGFPDGSLIFLVDGVRVNEIDGGVVNYPLVRMENIDAIEIAPGSSSAVYGSGAFAGVVNVTTRQPSEKPVTFFGGVEWTSFRGIRFRDGLSGTLEDKWSPLGGKLTYYFNGARDQAKGFRNNGEWRITSFDLKTGYELPDEIGGIRFGLKYVDDATSNPGALTLDEFRQNWRQSITDLDGRKFKNTILQLDANHKFWGERLNASIQASIRRNRIEFITTSRTFTDFTDGFNPDTDLVSVRTREKNLIGQLSYDHTWGWFRNQSLIGFELNRAMNHDKEQDAFGGHVVETTALEDLRSSEVSNVGLFWNERLHLNEWIIGHFGIRNDHYWLAMVNGLNHAKDLNRHWHSTNVSTGLVLKPIESIDLFGNYSEAFRIPSLSDFKTFGDDLPPNLRPEKSDNFELGTRLRYQDKASFKLSYFEIITRDEILFDSSAITNSNPFGRNINAGKTRRNGIETRLDLHPIDEVNFYGTYTYARAKIRKTVDDAASSGAPFLNRPLGQVPQHRFTVGMTARPFKRLGPKFEGFQLHMDGVLVGKQFIQSFESTTQSLLNGAGSGTIKPYAVWNLKLSYEFKKKELFFKINNLFDKRYYSRAVAATSFGTLLSPAGDYLFVNPAAPREFVLGFNYEF